MPDRVWLGAGLLLTAGYVAQAALGLEWLWLVELQREELYKRLSGSVLALYLGLQWRLSYLRTRGRFEAARASLATHRRLGVLAPVLLYAHSVHLGYAYLQLLSVVFLANTALGFLQEPLKRLRRLWLSSVSLVLHVALSALLTLLAVIHAVVAIYYE